MTEDATSSAGNPGHAPQAAASHDAPLLTVEYFMRTVLTALLDTPVAKRELAALFLAASGAWEQAVREYGWRRRHELIAEAGAATASGDAGTEDDVTSNTRIVHEACAPVPGPQSSPDATPSASAQHSAAYSVPNAASSMLSEPSSAVAVSPTPASRCDSRLSDFQDASTSEILGQDVGADSSRSPLVPTAQVSARRKHLSGDDPAMGGAEASSSTPNFRARPSSPLMRRPTSATNVATNVEIPRPESPDQAVVRDILRCHGCSGGDACAEQRALASFCTHPGVICWGCQSMQIEGPRFVCTSCATEQSINLCAQCRNSVRIGDDYRITVYDHPWEAEEEYRQMHTGLPTGAHDYLKVPRAPLSLGNKGPRVMHLHYVLYKMGYLRLCNRSLIVGEYCEETRDTVARFQRDHQLLPDSTRRQQPSPALLAAGGPETGDQPGAYTVVTRHAILNLVREVELRYSQARCRTGQNAEAMNLRTAMAA